MPFFVATVDRHVPHQWVSRPLWTQNFLSLAWICRERTSRSRSTTEAEIVWFAASLFSDALHQIDLWEMLLGPPMGCLLAQDNQATIIVAQARYSQKLRYVGWTHKINIESIKEVLEREDVSIRYVNTNLQVADIFTKPVTPEKWESTMQIMNMVTGHKWTDDSA